jgi:hypothetical protein
MEYYPPKYPSKMFKRTGKYDLRDFEYSRLLTTEGYNLASNDSFKDELKHIEDYLKDHAFKPVTGPPPYPLPEKSDPDYIKHENDERLTNYLRNLKPRGKGRDDLFNDIIWHTPLKKLSEYQMLDAPKETILDDLGYDSDCCVVDGPPPSKKRTSSRDDSDCSVVDGPPPSKKRTSSRDDSDCSVVDGPPPSKKSSPSEFAKKGMSYGHHSGYYEYLFDLSCGPTYVKDMSYYENQ